MPTLQALIIIITAPVGALIAWRQWQIARIKSRHELYSQPYQATQRLVANVCANADATDEDLRTFVRDTGGMFLLDMGLQRYLDEVRMRATNLHAINCALEITAVGERKARFVNNMSEHLEWFAKQLQNGLTDKFK